MGVPLLRGTQPKLNEDYRVYIRGLILSFIKGNEYVGARYHPILNFKLLVSHKTALHILLCS
jgi:hypothetical protein